MKNDGVMVSVYMLTYNHEEYVAQAIESVLMQKVNFKFELVIGDDASTDGTANIIQEYAKKYPNIIRAYCRKKNIGALRNSISIRSKCRGRYLAILEGDDFWNVDNKLQIQIDFLENHLEYSMCFTDVHVIKHTAESICLCIKKDINSMEEYLNGGRYLIGLPTATMVYRNIYQKNPELFKYFTKNSIVGDRIQHTLLLQFGKLKYLPIKTATYRFIVSKGDSYSAMDKLYKMEEMVRVLKVCMCISEKRYYHLWRMLISNHTKLKFEITLLDKGIMAAFKKVIFDIDMDIIDEIYLLRKLISE